MDKKGKHQKSFRYFSILKKDAYMNLICASIHIMHEISRDIGFKHIMEVFVS